MAGSSVVVHGARQRLWHYLIVGTLLLHQTQGDQIGLPDFSKLKVHYPGYAHHGGRFHDHQLVQAIGCDSSLLLHDTSALRLSVALNKIGGPHSLGKELIRLSKYGRDSVSGRNSMQYIYHPIAYGPYLADKYGYPTVSKLHESDPLSTKKNFWGKQGILRVITYTKKQNMPKGHVALWDCDHFHQARDWIAGHSLITVEFWESPDSDCSNMQPAAPPPADFPRLEDILPQVPRGKKLRHHHWEKKFVKKYFQLHKQLSMQR
ncbi:uncharacterized protein LOC131937270 [Physella acuta]|uniref:uncharacterized protein LOC131937270 n=1 Tax=Physella acuta TaxID=109671 RepID=UPI0027DCB242|nr:uncharacterized protein LOC131937270 [Physella acuta]